MELTGDERKIRALFSELSLEDQSQVPRFERLWVEAAPKPLPRPNAVVSSFLAVATVLLICGGVYFAIRSTHPAPSVTRGNGLIVSQLSEARAAVTEVAGTLITANHRKVKARRPKRPARVDRSERVLAKEVALLSAWQSPTEGFMESPSSSFSSLPQLNQSAKELERFLSVDNE